MLSSVVSFLVNSYQPLKKGLVETMANGVLAGYPMVDIKAKLYDGSYHDVDSSETAFKVAASLANERKLLKLRNQQFLNQ